MNWHSVRVYYYADDKDALILHGVRPLFDRLPGDVAGGYFLRHWKQGPHLRLNLRCTEGTLTEKVRPIVDDTIGSHLRARPSTLALDPERHLPMHRRLAELEGEPGPLLPWYPDNSIRYAALGGERTDTDDLLAGFYADTNELAFEMIEGIAGGRQRHRVAFDLMLSTAHALSGIGIIRGGISFRSHAEAFLNGYPEGQGRLERWEEHYARNSGALVGRVRAVVATLDGEGGGRGVPVPYVRNWVAALAPYRRKVEELVAAGRLPQATRGRTDLASARAELGNASPFHRELFATPEWAQMQQAEWFLCYRVLLNYTYLHLTRLGITPAERFLLCHLAANAIEECYGGPAGEPTTAARAGATVDTTADAAGEAS